MFSTEQEQEDNILVCLGPKLEWQQRLGEWQENPTDNLLSATDWPNSSHPENQKSEQFFEMSTG